MHWIMFVPFVWIWTFPRSTSTASAPCLQNATQTTLREFKHCDLSFEDGHLRSLCHGLVTSPNQHKFIPAKPDVITIEQLLVSEDPVQTSMETCVPTCLSLRQAQIKKWGDFPDESAGDYDEFKTPEWSTFGPFSVYYILICIVQLTVEVTFQRPPTVAVAMCHNKHTNTGSVLNVYGIADYYNHAFPASSAAEAFDDFVRVWNLAFTSSEALNVTFSETVKNIPTELLKLVSLTPITHLTFFKCNFKRIWLNEIPEMKLLEHLEFSQSPISEVHRKSFKRVRSLRILSLTGTNLPYVPQAVFSLTTLTVLNMSHTNVPADIPFTFSPEGCENKSSAQQLIMRGSNLTSLLNRAFCAFPNLQYLDLDSCELRVLEGAPFEGLSKLETLTLISNRIPWFSYHNLQGLTRLKSLMLSGNHLSVFDGMKLLSPLKSLQVLDLSFNRIQQLLVGKTVNSSLEQLFLKHNGIKKWNPPLFSIMRNLDFLSLENNALSFLEEGMLHDLNDIKNVNLSFNNWDCYSCFLNNLHTFLETHPERCSHCVTCKGPDDLQGKDVRGIDWRKEECGPLDFYKVYAVPGLLCIMIGSLIVYGAYKNRWYFMYASLYLKVGIKGYRRQKSVGEFAWDAFVSYHGSDSEWVHGVLLPGLESSSMKFRICFAERDFIPGVPITENICRAIAQSRVSMSVLSRDFCRSRWCMFELTLAQHRLFDSERQDSLVLIKKEQLDDSEMTDMLVFLTKSRTYIEVPPDGSTEGRTALFWLQLQAALEQ